MHSSKSLSQKYLSYYFNRSIQELFESGNIECIDESNFLLQKNEFVAIEFSCNSVTKKTKQNIHQEGQEQMLELQKAYG